MQCLSSSLSCRYERGRSLLDGPAASCAWGHAKRVLSSGTYCGWMDTLDRTFWLAFERDLASLTPLVDGLLERGDWAARDLYSSVDGVELVEATWRLFGLRDRLATETQVSAQDRLDLRAFLMGKPEWAPSITSAPAAVSPPGGSEPFTDEEEVLEKVADSIANLIEVRSRIQAGTYRSPLELARLDNELASAIELLRLITRDVRHQDETQGSMGPA